MPPERVLGEAARVPAVGVVLALAAAVRLAVVVVAAVNVRLVV